MDNGEYQAVTHVPFNPTPLGLNDSPITRICGDWERGGWTLQRVVAVSQFEAVAVFVRGSDGGV